MTDQATAGAPCALCGLDCGASPQTGRFGPDNLPFCCAGCVNVYAILMESGMLGPGVSPRDTRVFKRSLEMGLVSTPGSGAPARSVVPDGIETAEAMYQLSGLWCSSCAWLIEHALTREPGIVSADVHFASDLVKVRYAPQLLPPERIPARIAALGYGAEPYTGGTEAADREGRDLLLRLGVATFLWVNVMMLNLAIYIGYFQATPDSIRHTLPWVLAALTVPAVTYGAWPILRLAWLGAAHRTVRMETLLALGILAAFSYSTAEAVRGGDHIYFDTVCAIVALVLVGKNVERAAKTHTARTVTMLHRLMPTKARLVSAGQERFVSVEALKPGDQFLVKAGERVPADGEILEGEAHLDESALTGEAAPIARRAGGMVSSGTLAIDGVLRVRAARVGGDTTLTGIVRAVEQALAKRSHIEQAVDRVSRVFVPGVVVLSVLTFVAWWLLGGMAIGDALMQGITVLVIACPCALGIATPLAVTAAVGAASRLGILVGDSRALETVDQIDTVVLDKTGTVTWGEFALTGGSTGHLALLAAVEACSEHPLGRAVVARARQTGLAVDVAREVQVIKGQGISGTVNGRRITIGSRRLVSPDDQHLLSEAAGWERQGGTVSYFAIDGTSHGWLGFGDRIREDAADLVARLKARRIRTLIVSGDSCATTAWVASRIGVDDYRADVLPEGKAALVSGLQAEGRSVAMVGDGINDAPALAVARLGIALGSGTDIAMKAASAVLMHNRLGRVIEIFDLSRRTMLVIRQNLFWAFFYNTAGIGLAVAGLLNPIVAAAGMVLSSASVVGNSYRLSRPRG
ncbi:MAG: cation-translocating P-type ATPase [Acidobacteriota bacterium]